MEAIQRKCSEYSKELRGQLRKVSKCVEIRETKKFRKEVIDVEGRQRGFSECVIFRRQKNAIFSSFLTSLSTD